MSFVIDKTKELNLQPGEYIVIGSGILDAMGIREAHDVDMVVSQEVYDKLKTSGFKELKVILHDSEKKKILTKGDYEICTYWEDGRGKLYLDDLLKESQEVGGVTFVSLEMLRNWKKWAGREKDLRDIKLISTELDKVAKNFHEGKKF